MNKIATEANPPRLLDKIRSEVASELINEFGYSSPMQVPRLDKVVINVGLGESLQNSRAFDSVMSDLAQITGQKPVATKARQSIAGFKIREGMPIGAKVTLRGRRMYEFVDRLLNAALPRIRDFQGIQRNCFDGRGNCSIGISEHTIFPEIDYNSIDRIRGVQIVIVTSATNDQEGMRFLELIGMPFVRV